MNFVKYLAKFSDELLLISRTEKHYSKRGYCIFEWL